MAESYRLSYHKKFNLIVFICFVAAGIVESASLQVGKIRIHRDIHSLSEIRWRQLTRQGWDVSCGASALSSILTYHHEKPFSEMAITLTILKNSDPNRVKKRGGFSLYDLKRFVQAVGFEGLGFADMEADDLGFYDMPAILPTRVRGLAHFVVFKKKLANHILLMDPAFGNLSLPMHKFEEIWKSRIAFYVVTPEEKYALLEGKKGPKRSPLSPDFMDVAIPDLAYLGRMINKIPIIPLTKKNMTVVPLQ